jgi:hypothetical protein
MQDRYLAGIDESLLQRAAGPYIGVTSVDFGPFAECLLTS